MNGPSIPMQSPRHKESDLDLSNPTRRTRDNAKRAFKFADLSKYSFKDRLLIRVADLVFFAVMKLIGTTIRFEINGWENQQSLSHRERIPIYASWHNRNFISTYFWRRRGIMVMTSQSFDGEISTRLIQRFGYGAVRGSSTRGAIGALLEMARLMRAGHAAGLTVDGPKGPCYVVKKGAIVLAKKTGAPVLPFVITAARYWEVKKSWDRFQVPKPFTRANVLIAAPIHVPQDADDLELEAKRVELQRALDDLGQQGERWRAGISSD